MLVGYNGTWLIVGTCSNNLSYPLSIFFRLIVGIRMVNHGQIQPIDGSQKGGPLVLPQKVLGLTGAILIIL